MKNTIHSNISNFSFSQKLELSGKIINEKNNPIEFAEILLLIQDSVAIKNEFSNALGLFYILSN